MKYCKNCGKEIENGLDFCSKDCTGEFKNSQEGQELDEKTRQMYKMELDLLEKSIGKQVELGLSRGPTVRGTVTAFDQKYGKIAVEIKENGRFKTTIVKVTYIISFSIYDTRVEEIKSK